MRARRTAYVLLALLTVAAAGAGPVLSAAAVGPAANPTARPVCERSPSGYASCFAVRLSRGGRTLSSARPALGSGPAGGYTPAQLAAAYGLNVSGTAAATQTVAIVDAFDDPTVKSDLAAFDAHYGIAAETATSFRVVNQSGATAPLPAPDAGWAAEITLDVQSVRGLCRKCRILLVEADSNSTADLAAAANRAAAMHATEISNSYGESETDASVNATTNAAYNHAGIVVTASTGDDGWYDWDVINSGVASGGSPNVPAALNTVVGVSGTSLYLNPDGTRAGETVWNGNGPNDQFGNRAASPLGAAGGGCSAIFAAQRWQRFVAGDSTLGCASGKRSETDIAAIADPLTGYDVFGPDPTTPGPSGWATFGGTSLSSPVVAAMWALAGGAHGVPYPALTLYGHFRADAVKPTFDVTIGGTGACSTSSTTTCFNFFGNNPNDLGFGLVDCAFPATGAGTLANRGQCYARPGYDGVSGVGTPRGLRTFAPIGPHPYISSPGTVTHGVTKTFSASHSTDPFPGGALTKFVWHWGDGRTTTTTSRTAAHRYATKGKKTITLTATDNYARTGSVRRVITVA